MTADQLLTGVEAERKDSATRPHVSVIIPARNAAHTIAQQLEALAKQAYPGDWEVIVADNASTDGTRRMVESFADRFERLQVVDASGRPGVNHARNAGARVAAGELLLFCDADDVVAPGWIAGLVRGLQAYDAAGGSLDVESLNEGAPKGLRAQPVPQDQLPLHAGFLPRPQGANMGVRRDVLAALGGFDERFEFGGTETELFWRLQLEGYTLGFTPEAAVRYRYHTSVRAGVRQRYRYGCSHALLYRVFRDRGMPRTSARQVLDSWLWLARHLPDLLRSSPRRLRWIGRAAMCFGHVVGSVRHRVVYL